MEANVKMNPKRMGVANVDWIQLDIERA